MEDFRLDWYNDSDSTSSGPASQIRSTLEWQNVVDPSGNVFFVKKLTRRQFSHAGSRNSSTLTVNHLQKTPSGFFGKLIRRRSSRKGSSAADEAFPNISDQKLVDPAGPVDGDEDDTRRLLPDENPNSNPDVEQFCPGVLYTTLDQLEGATKDSVIYCYPPTDNLLSNARGLFVTLLHLLPSVLTSRPTTSSLRMNGFLVNVAYVCDGSDVVLLSLPESRCSRNECRRILNELCCYQKFIFQTLTRCYATPVDDFTELDSFFDALFRKVDCRLMNSSQEKLLSFFPVAAPYLVVPRDIYLQVEESLNELESNEIPFDDDDQRRFSIVGCAYFYKGFAVCSHLLKDDLLEVFTLMRDSGVLQYCSEGIKDLVYWKEVFPVSCNRGLLPSTNTPYSTPGGPWFALIVALGHNSLVTLLESGGCCAKVPSHCGPDPLYVEEAQATLRHIVKLGTAHFLSKWIGERDSVNEGKISSGRSSQSLSSFGESYHKQGSVKSFDLIDYEAAAEDNMPVLGRRAERHLNEITYHSVLNLAESAEDLNANKETKSSDNLSEGSDLSKKVPGEGLFVSNHRICGSKYDQYFHYVHLDSSEGIVISNLFSEPSCSSFDRIAENFKIQVRQIQDVFRNTVLFQSKSSDISSTPLNKSMVAIKEYGTLFEMDDEDEKTGSLLYWVAGRLLSHPTPRELYVCYQDSCPQNLVELAFHLALTASR